MVTIMKKLLKLNYIALFAVLALFSACTEESEYTPAQPSAETNAYRFSASSESNVVLALTDSVYQVVLERDDVTEEVTLPLSVKGDLNIFSAPSSVTFAAGESQALVNIEIAPEMDAFKNFYLELSIDESYVNPYTADNFSVLPITFLKEDYAPFALGVYSSWFFGQSWEAVLEYSPMLDLYRFKDCWFKGDVTFTCNRETMEFEMSAAQFETGYVHPSYGMVVAKVLGSNNGFDPETNTFYFAYQFIVSAGSFGADYDTFEIKEVYE